MCDSGVRGRPGMATDNLRKIRKPLIERKRRERINNCLSKLRNIIIDDITEKEGIQMTRLDKAEVLEMTVKHLRNLKNRKTSRGHNDDTSVSAFQYSEGYQACARAALRYLGDTGVNHTARLRLEQHVLPNRNVLPQPNNNSICNTSHVGRGLNDPIITEFNASSTSASFMSMTSQGSAMLQPLSVEIPTQHRLTNSPAMQFNMATSLLVPVHMFLAANHSNRNSSTEDREESVTLDSSACSNNDSGVFCLSSPSPSNVNTSAAEETNDRPQDIIWRPW